MAVCLTVAALAVVGAGGEDEDVRAISLAGVGESGVREASVPLEGRLGRSIGGWRSARVDTSSYSMLALTWRGPDVRARVRTHGPDGWSTWRRLEPLKQRDHGVQGTELLWVPDSDGFEVKVDPAREELTIELFDPGELSTDITARAIPPSDEKDQAPRPELLTREDWGADGSWRNGDPYYLRGIKQVHVHHTATGNSYSRREVAGIIRGMYRYHTNTLGWSDLGYNFVIDRFGRTWIGRAGGYTRAVRGAHTLGFNHASTGVAVLGTYMKRAPSYDAIRSLVHLAAWKLDLYDRDPAQRTSITSKGSDLFAEGDRVRLPVIDGHRDTNQTACPGNRLYRQLSRIRDWAQARVDRFDPRRENR